MAIPWKTALSLTLSLSMTGCAHHQSGAFSRPNAAAIGASDAETLQEASAGASTLEPSMQMPDPSGMASEGGVADAFKRAGNAMKDALTIQPRVIPPDDPVSLASGHEGVDADIHVKAGQFFETQGRFGQAIEQYDRALELNSGHLGALIALARLQDRQGNLDEAIGSYRRAVKAHPTHAAAYNDLGLCYARQKNIKKSLESLERAVRLSPDSKLYRNNIATVLVENGEFDRALEHLKRAHPEASAHYNLGYLLHRRGEDDAARRHFETSLRANPSLSVAREMLARLDGAPGKPAEDPSRGSREYRLRGDDLSPQAAPSPPSATSVVKEVRRTPPVPSQAGEQSPWKEASLRSSPKPSSSDQPSRYEAASSERSGLRLPNSTAPLRSARAEAAPPSPDDLKTPVMLPAVD